MKALVFLLVLANLLFYALSNGLLGRPDNPDAGRNEQQIAVDRIRLVSRGEAPASKTAPPPAPVPPAAPPAAPPEKPVDVCLRWEALSAGDAERLLALINGQFPALAAKRQGTPGEGKGWWVYIPPLASKAEAEKKALELRQRGITDYFILLENSAQPFAVSLGVFSSEKGAQDRFAELKAKGIKSMRLAIRPGKETQFSIEARGPLPDKTLLTGPAGEILPKTAPLNCK